MGCCGGRTRRSKKAFDTLETVQVAAAFESPANGAHPLSAPLPPAAADPATAATPASSAALQLDTPAQQELPATATPAVSTPLGVDAARPAFGTGDGMGRSSSNNRSKHHAKSNSMMSENDWQDAREEFSINDGTPPGSALCSSSSISIRPPSTTQGEVSTSAAASPKSPVKQTPRHHANGASPLDVHIGRSDTSEEAMNKLGCMSIIDSLRRGATTPQGPSEAAAAQHSPGSTSQANTPHAADGAATPSGEGGAAEEQPAAGCSLTVRDMSMDWTEVREGYERCDATTFRIRGLDYMRTKQKEFSAPSFYHLLTADMFSFDTKAMHIATMLSRLPDAPAPRHLAGGDSGLLIPPLLIINIQLPTYAPSFFGCSDGPGHSIVLYLALDEHFDPSTANPKALALLQRFVRDGKEADGTSTRDRLKLIVRAVNVEEWALKGPLSNAEQRALTAFNEKPMLTRPQQHFFQGPNYLEIDLDVHLYAFMARKALQSYFTRLREVVWETAFVIQGNTADELPEVVLGAARLYRTDFEQRREFRDFVTTPAAAAGRRPP